MTFNIWSELDPPEAEARLRGLRRRLSELDAALTDQQSLLRDYPESAAMQLGVQSLAKMDTVLRAELVGILCHRENERIKLALDGPHFVGHSARFSDLGVFFSRFQKLYSSIAQAITSGPTTRGPISSAVQFASDLRLSSTFASSFGLDVYVPSSYDLTGTSISSDALEQLFQLLNAATSAEKLMPVSGTIGRRALVHLRSLAVLLGSTDSEMTIAWSDYSGVQYTWKADKARSEQILHAIDSINQTRSEAKEVHGVLVGASLLRHRFEIISDDGNLIEGKYVAGLGPFIQDVFGKRVVASLDETEITDLASGEVKTFHALKTIGEEQVT